MLETTSIVGSLKTCEEEVMGFNGDKDVKDFDGELSIDSEGIKGLKVCDFDYELHLNMIYINPMKFSMVNKEVDSIAIEDLVIIDKEFIIKVLTKMWINGNVVNVSKKYEGSRVNVKRKSTEDKVRCEKVFEVDGALDYENSRASSF